MNNTILAVLIITHFSDGYTTVGISDNIVDAIKYGKYAKTDKKLNNNCYHITGFELVPVKLPLVTQVLNAQSNDFIISLN